MADPSGRTEYLETTLGLVKRLEISKELIRECVTVPGCCCCMPLLHNHLMDSCSYVRKIHCQRGVHFHPPYPPPPPKSATAHFKKFTACLREGLIHEWKQALLAPPLPLMSLNNSQLCSTHNSSY